MSGPIEADETYIGGNAKNQHASQRDKKPGVGSKYLVVDILEPRTGEVPDKLSTTRYKDELRGYREENVRWDATL